MENKTTIKYEHIKEARKMAKLQGLPLTRFITFDVVCLVAVIVLAIVYRNDQWLGMILPIVLVVIVIAYSIYYLSQALSLSLKRFDPYEVTYSFEEKMLVVKIDSIKKAVSYQRISQVIRQGEVYFLVIQGSDPLIVDSNGFIDATKEDFETLLSRHNLRIS